MGMRAGPLSTSRGSMTQAMSHPDGDIRGPRSQVTANQSLGTCFGQGSLGREALLLEATAREKRRGRTHRGMEASQSSQFRDQRVTIRQVTGQRMIGTGPWTLPSVPIAQGQHQSNKVINDGPGPSEPKVENTAARSRTVTVERKGKGGDIHQEGRLLQPGTGPESQQAHRGFKTRITLSVTQNSGPQVCAAVRAWGHHLAWNSSPGERCPPSTQLACSLGHQICPGCMGGVSGTHQVQGHSARTQGSQGPADVDRGPPHGALLHAQGFVPFPPNSGIRVAWQTAPFHTDTRESGTSPTPQRELNIKVATALG